MLLSCTILLFGSVSVLHDDYMGMSTIWAAVDMLWHIVLYSIRISCSIWPVLTLWMQVENRMRYIMYICHCYDCIHLYVYIYDFIYCILEIDSPHTRLYVWPAFLSILSMLTTLGCSPRAAWSQVWTGYSSRSRLWSTEPTCRCVYISVVYSYHMTDCIFSMRCILRYYSVPIMYWLYSICFRGCISYCISFIYSVHVSWLLYFIPAMWDCCR